MGGEEKLQQALAYTSDQLEARGIKAWPEEIRAAVETAYLTFKATLLSKH